MIRTNADAATTGTLSQTPNLEDRRDGYLFIEFAGLDAPHSAPRGACKQLILPGGEVMAQCATIIWERWS